MVSVKAVVKSISSMTAEERNEMGCRDEDDWRALVVYACDGQTCIDACSFSNELHVGVVIGCICGGEVHLRVRGSLDTMKLAHTGMSFKKAEEEEEARKRRNLGNDHDEDHGDADDDGDDEGDDNGGPPSKKQRTTAAASSAASSAGTTAAATLAAGTTVAATLAPIKEEVIPMAAPIKEEVIPMAAPNKEEVIPMAAPNAEEVIPMAAPNTEENIAADSALWVGPDVSSTEAMELLTALSSIQY
jgi:hypothetical protein